MVRFLDLVSRSLVNFTLALSTVLSSLLLPFPGFSLGDELGFEQSLTNLDPSRRRSVSVRNGAPPNIIDSSPRPAAKQEVRMRFPMVSFYPTVWLSRNIYFIHRNAKIGVESSFLPFQNTYFTRKVWL